MRQLIIPQAATATLFDRNGEQRAKLDAGDSRVNVEAVDIVEVLEDTEGTRVRLYLRGDRTIEVDFPAGSAALAGRFVYAIR